MRIFEYAASIYLRFLARAPRLLIFEARLVMDVGDSVDPHKARQIKEMT